MMAQVLPSELFQEVLEQLDMLTLLNVKGVSKTWRTKARSVVWAWLCRREGQPVPASRVAVTDVDIEPFVKADGPDVAHVGEAMVRFPNLARMHAHGFVVDVAAVRGLGPAPVFYGMQHVLQPVRGCIGGEGEPPGGLLLAVRAARYGEAHVPNGAFCNCRSLTTLTIPAGFTEIGGSAFFRCSSLFALTLPASLTTIGNSAFEFCSSLTALTLPASLTTIGFGAFSNCSSLTALTLPASLAMIGNSTFMDCSSLTTLTLPASVATIDINAFNNCSSLTTLTLPAGVATIDDAAFDDCSSLTTLTIVSDHAEPRMLTREQPFDTVAVRQALEQARAA